ncbi:MAG: hypothetical protein SOY94_01270 [Candidatus Limiplasma sp.]|nr:hypothetical protein [Candidatus Limiplasma sp.]
MKTWEKIKRKLASSKMWLAIGSFVSMLIVATGGTQEEAAQVAALIMAGGTVIAYIVAEGMIDKESVGSNVIVTVDKTGQEAQDKS